MHHRTGRQRYSVPWQLIGARVTVVAGGGRVGIHREGLEVAVHAEAAGRRQRVIDPTHLHAAAGHAPPTPPATPNEPPALLRPLAEYELAVGGGW